jgi:aspartate ammonia-lyase
MDNTVGIVTALNPVLGIRQGDRVGAGSLSLRQGPDRDHREQKALTEDQIKDILIR